MPLMIISTTSIVKVGNCKLFDESIKTPKQLQLEFNLDLKLFLFEKDKYYSASIFTSNTLCAGISNWS